MEMLYILNHWHWWALGALFVLGELLAPCAYYMAIGVAAVLTGLVTRFFPEMPGLWQLALFIALSVLTTALAHISRHRRKTTGTARNKH